MYALVTCVDSYFYIYRFFSSNMKPKKLFSHFLQDVFASQSHQTIKKLYCYKNKIIHACSFSNLNFELPRRFLYCNYIPPRTRIPLSFSYDLNLSNFLCISCNSRARSCLPFTNSSVLPPTYYPCHHKTFPSIAPCHRKGNIFYLMCKFWFLLNLLLSAI